MTERGARPGGGLLVSLLAGRTAFRLTLLGANAALLASWGGGPYERYAHAMGTAQVLTTLTSLGIEKSALKLVPRARRTVPQLIGVFLGCAVLLTSAAGLWLGGTALFGSGTGGPLPLLAGVYAALLGLNTVLVGLCRALGRDRADVAVFTALSAVVASGTAVTLLTGAGPALFTGWLLAGTALLDLALLPVLLRAAARPRRRPLARAAVSTSVLMSCGDVAAAGAVSLLIALLGVSPHHAQSSHLYLMVLASSVLLNGFGYVLRIFQPHVSLRLRSTAPADLHRSVVRRLLPLAAAGTVWTGAALLLAGRAQEDLGVPPAVAVLLMYLLCVPLFFAAGTVNYLLENATSATLRATAVSALAGLACAAGLGIVLVPALGALGAVTALAAGEIAHLVAARMLLRSGAPAPAPAARPCPEPRAS